MNRLLLTAFLALAFTSGGCGNSSSVATPTLPTVPMTLGSRNYTLEIANDTAERERGLMRRDSMASDHGMIFVFPVEQKLGFYMKNTRIPLDIIYVNANGVVVSVKQMRPYDQTTVSSDGPAKWAIELNQGQAAECGVKAGDQLTIPEPARVAEE
jgi:uncharacterized membrane protein (UPF0127 family)